MRKGQQANKSVIGELYLEMAKKDRDHARLCELYAAQQDVIERMMQHHKLPLVDKKVFGYEK